MLDIKTLRENPQKAEEALRAKDPTISLKKVLELDEEIRALRLKLEELKHARNNHSKEIGKQRQDGKKIDHFLDMMEKAKHEIAQMDNKLTHLEKALQSALHDLPNLPSPNVTVSFNTNDNVCINRSEDTPCFSFRPKNHLELNEILHLFDFKRGAKIAGSGWPTYRGIGARLEWALINFMIDTHLNHGFEQWIPPLVGRSNIMFGSAHLPKFEDQFYKIDNRGGRDSLYLIPTAEAVLNGLHYDEILDRETLPIRYCAYTPCFRKEAGAAGAQERGLIRSHQFNKVEMFAITHPNDSELIFEEMISRAEEIVKALDIPYRTMLLVTGESSFAAAKTVDVEAWLPGQNCYYEVSSISNCTDFQARRSKIRFRKGKEKPQLVHTLNGSGLATSRLVPALLENHQREDGSIALPPVLHRYLGGLTELKPPDLRPI